MSNRRQSLGFGAVLASVAAALFVISGYLVNVWLGRLLGPAEYGRFGIAIGLVTILNVIQNAAIPQAVARMAAERPRDADGTLRRGAELQVSVAALMTVGLLVGAPVVAGVLGDDRLGDALRVSALALVPYGLFMLLVAFHNGRRSYTRQAVASGVYAAAKAVLAISFAYGFGLVGALAGYVGAACLGLAAAWHRVWSSAGPVSHWAILRFAGPMSLYAMASVGQLSIDIFLLKAMTGAPEAIGFYAAAQNIARIPYYLMGGLAAIILPAVAAARQDRPGRDARTASQALRWALIGVLPVSAVIQAMSPQVVELLYTDRYAPAADVLWLLTPAMAAFSIASIAAGILSGSGRPAVSALLAGVGLFVTIAANVILIPHAGPSGAAVGTLIGCFVTLLGALAVLHRTVQGSIPVSSVARVGAIAVVVGIVARFLPGVGLPLILATVALGAMTVAMLFGFRELSMSDFRRLAMRDRQREPAAGREADEVDPEV